MFALWYGEIFYRVYRDRIWNLYNNNRGQNPAPVEAAPAQDTTIPSHIPVATSRAPKPTIPDTPKTPFVPKATSTPAPTRAPEPFKVPEPPKTVEPVKLEPPPKPPRSPSPHPLKTDTFEEIEYEEEEDEVSTDGEEEDSVISSSPRRKLEFPNER